MSKTTTKIKEKYNGKKERQEKAPEEQKTILTVIPAGGSIVVSDQRDHLKLRVIRMANTSQIKVFEPDIAELFERYVKKSKEDRQVCLASLLDFIAYSHLPGVFFLVGIDENYKCRMYCLAHLMSGGVFFIRQLIYDTRYNASMDDSWKSLEEMVKENGCKVIEGSTKRDEKSYSRWAKRFGMNKQCTIYRKEVV